MQWQQTARMMRGGWPCGMAGGEVGHVAAAPLQAQPRGPRLPGRSSGWSRRARRLWQQCLPRCPRRQLRAPLLHRLACSISSKVVAAARRAPSPLQVQNGCSGHLVAHRPQQRYVAALGRLQCLLVATPAPPLCSLHCCGMAQRPHNPSDPPTVQASDGGGAEPSRLPQQPRARAISSTGHTCRGRVKQKSHKSADLVAAGSLR